jgi:RND family efflux transporter MFP subunit
MRAINVIPIWTALLGLTVMLCGCAHETSLAETPPVEVVVAQAAPSGKEPDLIRDWDTYTGNVYSKESIEVKSRVKGHVIDVPFSEGEEIAADTVLFLIDAEPFKADLKRAQGDLTTWEAKQKFADEQIALYKPLAEKGTVSKEDLLKAISAKDEAIGGVAKAKAAIRDAELNIGYCKITAPIDGRVGEAMLSKGDLVNSSGADSLLTTIVAVDPMYVTFNVNEPAYKRYRDQLLEKAKKEPPAKGAKLKIPVQLAVAGEPFSDKSLVGYVDFVDNRVDPATASIKVRAKFENQKGLDGRRPLTPGMFARVRVTLGEPVPAVLVADRAILTDQSLKYVLVVNKEKDNVVERVDVRASDRLQEDGRRAVEGLKGDAWVIVDGVNRARPGIKVSPQETKEMPRRLVSK